LREDFWLSIKKNCYKAIMPDGSASLFKKPRGKLVLLPYSWMFAKNVFSGAVSMFGKTAAGLDPGNGSPKKG
jgi:hypothetical protein